MHTRGKTRTMENRLVLVSLAPTLPAAWRGGRVHTASQPIGADSICVGVGVVELDPRRIRMFI